MAERAAIWIRVSGGKQDERQQLPKLERYCDEHSYDVRKVYEVHAMSAYKGEQQADLDQMLADLEAGTFTVLVCWHSDRLERRGGLAMLALLAEIKDAGGRVESHEEGVLKPDSDDDDMDSLMSFIRGRENRSYSRKISANVRRAHDELAGAGSLIGKVPFGYAIAGERRRKRMVATEIGRTYVPQIFDRIIAGDSLRTIAAWLTREGIETVAHATWRAKSADQRGTEPGNVWNEGVIGHLARKDAYTGTRTGYGHEIECEQLVDTEKYRRAMKALDSRPKRGAVDISNRALLAGVLYCLPCKSRGVQSPMYRIKAGKTNGHFYYRCTGSGAQRKGCGNMVDLAYAEALITATVESFASQPYTIASERDTTEAEQALAVIRLAIRKLGTLDIPDSEYDAKLAELRAERDRISVEVSKSGPAYEAVRNPDGTDQTIGQRWASLDPDGKRAMMLGAVRFYLAKDGTVAREGHLFGRA